MALAALDGEERLGCAVPASLAIAQRLGRVEFLSYKVDTVCRWSASTASTPPSAAAAADAYAVGVA
jgi:hypothetical protein